MLTNIELAKAKIALHSPEFISLTSKLEFVVNDDIPTAGTDGRRLFYNQAFIDGLTTPQVIGLVLHEIGHNMLAHPARVGLRDKKIANIAMDITLNQNLQDYFNETAQNLKAEFPVGGIFGPQFNKYEGWNWERVYADLIENPTTVKQFDFVEPGTNEDGTPMTAQECEALAKEWTMAAQQAATMAKARGFQSGFFESFVSGLTRTKVDWRAQVLDEAVKVAKEDSSYRKFNRRFVYNETYLPGQYSERIGLMVFATDTSGSMEDECFKLGLSGMNEIMADLRPEKIIHICCDTEVKSVEEFTADDLPIQGLKFKGRGGTILTPIFEAIKKLEEVPELVVVLTDGGCEVVSKSVEPPCTTVWLLTTDSFDAVRNSFGKIIRVEA